ncbi:MAG: Hsp20/alpha crystallin family protein [Calditrichia bacterium]|nr:Hsp20/alpha crystallin family protein [Calditrichia bacterium]
MTLSMYNPMNNFNALSKEMNRIFNNLNDQAVTDEETINEQVWTPRVNIAENKDKYSIELDLPGMSKKDIQINLKDNSLQIEGERKGKKETKESKEQNWVRKEAFYGKFSRSFTLPKDVDVSKTEANFKNGVLEVTLIKREETKPKEILINVN